MSGDDDEQKRLTQLIETNNDYIVYLLYSYQAILCYLFHNYTQALANIKLIETLSNTIRGSVFNPEFNFYYSLILLALYPQASKQQQRQYYLKSKT